MLFDLAGRPIDYVFIETNAAFAHQTGLTDALGRKMRDLAPEHEQHWFDIYGQIALSGEPQRFELPAEALGRWYDVYAFRIGDPQQRRVAILFNDVAERRRVEAFLRESKERQAFLLALSDALRLLSDAGDIQSATTRLLGEHLSVDRAMYGEVTGERGAEAGLIRGQFVREAAPGQPAPNPFPDRFTFERFGADVMARRYSGEGLAVSDVNNDPGFDAAERAAWAAVGTRAAIVVPLVKGGRLVAELGVHSQAPRIWTEAEITLVREVGERTWDAAERARAEAASRASEERYRSLFETISQGLAICHLVRDANGRVVDARFVELNPAYEEQTGFERAKAIGRLALEIFPSIEPFWLEMAERVVETGHAERIERFVADTGRWFAFEMARFGEPDQFVVIYDNITDRKQAEAALRESEDRQAFLMKIGDTLREIPTADEKISVAAQELGERLGASRVLWAEYDWQRRLAHIFGGWLATGAPAFPTVMQLDDYDGEVLRALRNGRTVRVDNVGLLVDEPAYAAIAEVGVQALLSVPSVIDGVLKVNLSIHQHEPRHWTDADVELVREVAERLWAEVVRARAESSLRASEDRFRRFADASSDVLWIRDGKTLLPTYASAAAAAVYGVPAERIVGDKLGWNSLIVPEDREAMNAQLIAGQRGQASVAEFRILRPRDGVFRYVRQTVFPFLDDHGDVEAVAGISSDITEARLLTDHQAVLLGELQHRVRNSMSIIRTMAQRSAEGATDGANRRHKWPRR